MKVTGFSGMAHIHSLTTPKSKHQCEKEICPQLLLPSHKPTRSRLSNLMPPAVWLLLF